MLDHLLCRCGHARQLHGSRSKTDSECRICSRVVIACRELSLPGPGTCHRFHWRWLPGLRRLASVNPHRVG